MSHESETPTIVSGRMDDTAITDSTGSKIATAVAALTNAGPAPFTAATRQFPPALLERLRAAFAFWRELPEDVQYYELLAAGITEETIGIPRPPPQQSIMRDINVDDDSDEDIFDTPPPPKKIASARTAKK